MNTGQMLLTLGAIILFGLQVLRVNDSEATTTEETNNSKFGVLAVALARSRIDRANGLKFDELTIMGNALPDANGNPSNGCFTAANALGCETNESTNGSPDESKFDDFDDYNNVTTVVDTLPSARYTISSTVTYVDALVGFTQSSTIKWDKQITVVVTSDNLTAPVTLRSINSYWRYN
jgi:hypothetical protein